MDHAQQWFLFSNAASPGRCVAGGWPANVSPAKKTAGHGMEINVWISNRDVTSDYVSEENIKFRTNDFTKIMSERYQPQDMQMFCCATGFCSVEGRRMPQGKNMFDAFEVSFQKAVAFAYKVDSSRLQGHVERGTQGQELVKLGILQAALIIHGRPTLIHLQVYGFRLP